MFRRISRITGAALLTTYSLLVLGASPSLATGTLDQQADWRQGGSNVHPGQTMAQTFTAGLTGDMDTVSVAMGFQDDPCANDVTLEVRDMTGSNPFTGTLLGSATFSTSLVTSSWTSPTWVSITLASPVTVVSGTQYALVLRTSVFVCNFLWNTSSEAYLGGTSWVMREAVVQIPSGDQAFRTYVTTATTDADGDGSNSTVDCDDDDAGRYPGLTEIANDGVDQNCNNYDQVTNYADADSDTYGVTSTATDVDGEQPANTATRGGDADDSNASIYPGADELCDGLDNDQNLLVDDGWPDTDVDGSADCVDPDDDGDGIIDGEDPDVVAEVVADPATSISSGNRKAFLARLGYVETLVADGNTASAIIELQALRKRTDGCGTKSDKNDWITDCDDQQTVRTLIDDLIASLNA